MTLVDGGNLLVALQDLQTTLKGNVEVPIIDTDFGSHNICYVTWANSPALIIRLVWQSSLATLPFCLEPDQARRLPRSPIPRPWREKWQSLQ